MIGATKDKPTQDRHAWKVCRQCSDVCVASSACEGWIASHFWLMQLYDLILACEQVVQKFYMLMAGIGPGPIESTVSLQTLRWVHLLGGDVCGHLIIIIITPMLTVEPTTFLPHVLSQVSNLKVIWPVFLTLPLYWEQEGAVLGSEMIPSCLCKELSRAAPRNPKCVFSLKELALGLRQPWWTPKVFVSQVPCCGFPDPRGWLHPLWQFRFQE